MKDTRIVETVPSVESWGVGSKSVVFSVRALMEALASLKDRRGRRGRRYPLALVLLLTVLAKLSGQDRPSGIACWVKHRRERLQRALGIPLAKTPHHNTYRRISENAVDPDELDKAVSEFFRRLPGVGESALISLDGKTVRGTIDAENPQGDHLLAAYLPEEGIVLFQVAAGSKENEITVAPDLLAAIDLRGKVVCGDAEHTQRKLSAQIRTAGGDYIWFVKDNQPTLREDIEQLFEIDDRTVMGGRVPNDFQEFTTVEKGHGRRETRKITVSSELKGYTDWPGLEQVFRLDRRRVDCKTGTETCDTAYGLTSLTEKITSPRRLLYLSRTYWGIENGLHGRRDTTFHEDHIRLTRGHAGRVMATINNLVIGLLRYAGFTNIALARIQCDANMPEALALPVACSVI